MHLITLTGMPRSGTAFCSTLLALHPDCTSYHELASFDKQWRATLCGTKTKYVADCSTYGYFSECVMPSEKFIWINHDPVMSHYASEAATHKKLDSEKFYSLSSIGNQWAYENKALFLDRQEVFTLEGCRKLWRYCFESYPFPVRKVENLLRLNIQQHEPHNERNAKFTV